MPVTLPPPSPGCGQVAPFIPRGAGSEPGSPSELATKAHVAARPQTADPIPRLLPPRCRLRGVPSWPPPLGLDGQAPLGSEPAGLTLSVTLCFRIVAGRAPAWQIPGVACGSVGSTLCHQALRGSLPRAWFVRTLLQSECGTASRQEWGLEAGTPPLTRCPPQVSPGVIANPFAAGIGRRNSLESISSIDRELSPEGPGKVGSSGPAAPGPGSPRPWAPDRCLLRSQEELPPQTASWGPEAAVSPAVPEPPRDRAAGGARRGPVPRVRALTGVGALEAAEPGLVGRQDRGPNWGSSPPPGTGLVPMILDPSLKAGGAASREGPWPWPPPISCPRTQGAGWVRRSQRQGVAEVPGGHQSPQRPCGMGHKPRAAARSHGDQGGGRTQC